MADEDLLADGEAVENQAPADDSVDAGPPPSSSAYPDWVPTEYHDPGKRGELLQALGFEDKQAPGERPEHVPEKFWKEGEGLQADALVKSYQELERTLHEKGKVPPETYEITPPNGVEVGEDESFLTEEDTALFKEAGLTNDQAQQIVNYYFETAMPAIMEERGRAELANLAGQWDMKVDTEGNLPHEFKQRLGEIRSWASDNLPEEVVSTLRTSAKGVEAMWQMMQAKSALPQQKGQVSSMSDAELQRIMNSDEYWNPANDKIRKQVEQEILSRS